MVRTTQNISDLIYSVTDPEIPVLSILDLGIVRNIIETDETIEVVITPTYSGCPAMLEIENNIRKKLEGTDHRQVKVTTVLFPPWTTDWMTEEGKKKLLQYGIVPPKNFENQIIVCPQCKSEHTKLVSEFGSTACKSLYKCEDCLEPFDYFKCH